MLPDFDGPDLPEAETTGQHRERGIREIALEAITQATAVAKVNRALKAKTKPDGGKLFKVGDLIDYHRPTTTKDDHGGWNGPCPVTAIHPDRGHLVCQNGSKPIIVMFPDARLTLFVEVFIARELGSDSAAMRTILTYIAEELSPGRFATFGYAPNHKGNYELALGSD